MLEEKRDPTLAATLSRLADSLGWDVPTFDEFAAGADAMLSRGYALPQEAPDTP